MNSGQLKVVDADGIQASQDTTLMSISRNDSNHETRHDWIMSEPSRPLSALSQQELESDKAKRNSTSKGKTGIYNLTKARFKNSKLQLLLKHENDERKTNFLGKHRGINNVRKIIKTNTKRNDQNYRNAYEE